MQFTIKTRQDGVPCIYLDLEKSKLPDVEPDNPLLMFPINQFTKIYTTVGDTHVATEGFIAINNFMHTLSKADADIAAMVLLIMHNRIRECFIGEDAPGLAGFTKVALGIDELLLDLNKKINLPQQLLDFIVTEVPINGATEGPLRAQDTEALTYRHNDIVKLHTLAFLCNLLLPIFGSVIYYLSSEGVKLGDKVRELHCMDCMSNTINALYAEPKQKLQAYIHAMVNNKYPPMQHSANRSLLHFGYTKSWAEIASLLNFLVRKVVNMNVYRESSNLINILNSGIAYLIETAIKKVNKDRRVEERKDLSIGDDRQQSEMELHSIATSKTGDWPIIVACFAPITVKQVIKEYRLNTNTHNELLGNIREARLLPNPVAKLLVKQIFSHRFSGTNMLKYLNLEHMSSMMAVVQQLAMRDDSPYLAHMVTASPTGMVYDKLPDILRQLLLGYRKRKEYKRCVDMLMDSPIRDREIRALFGDMVDILVRDLTLNEYVHNSPPVMLEDGYPKQGSPLLPEMQTMIELYEFMFDYRIIVDDV